MGSTAEHQPPAVSPCHICIVPYCHPDWAWTHTRLWHEVRYTLAINEALNLINQQDEAGVPPESPHAFRWYMDVFITELEPFRQRCPERMTELRRRVAEGRVAICGGYSNVRINHVEGETFVRSMIYGRRSFQEVFPEADLSVHADLVDVAVGYPQLPQLLLQAEYSYYRFWRPQQALTLKGIPYHFVWQGLDGSAVLSSRGSYGGICTSDMVPSDYCERWDDVARLWQQNELSHHAAHSPVPVYWVQQGADDNRPLRTIFYEDQPLPFPEFMEEWNRRESSTMEFATPVDVFRRLEQERERLPLVEGTLDPCDVCYNTAWYGSRGLWRLRSETARALVTAEALAVAAASSGATYPQGEIEQLWKDTLLFSAHAIQWLFQKDFDELHQLAELTLGKAKALQREALNHIKNQIAIPPDTMAIVFNPLPHLRTEVVPLLLTYVEGDKGGAPQPLYLVDGNGVNVPYQVENEMHHAGLVWEKQVLAKMELPAFGWNCIRWTSEPPTIAATEEVVATATDTNTILLENAFLAVEIQWGRVTRLREKRTDIQWLAPHHIPFGSLSAYQVDTSAHLHIGPILGQQDVEWTSWNIVEGGEGGAGVCRTVRMQGFAGCHPITQEVRLYAHEARVEFHVCINFGGMDGFIASFMPLPEGGCLHGDMPFCVEAKELSEEPYGPEAGIERQREGMFIAQSFVDWSDGERGLAYLSHDGDRYYIFSELNGTPALRHILVNSIRRPTDNWEKDINVQIEGVGMHSFTYSLLPHAGDWRTARLWRASQNLRTPPLITAPHAPHGTGNPVESLVELRPENVACSSCYIEGERVLIRVFETAGLPAEVCLTLPFTIHYAESVNLMGASLQDPCIEHDGRDVTFTLKPWQIATVSVAQGPR